jgi:hypothetical protein
MGMLHHPQLELPKLTNNICQLEHDRLGTSHWHTMMEIFHMLGNFLL